MTKVVVTREIPGELAIDGAEIVVGREEGYQKPGELVEFIKSHAPMDGLVSMVHDPIDAAALDAAGDSLKVVCNFAVGYNNIDVAECNRRGVTVCNTPHAVTEGTADIAWALLLAAARRVGEGERFVRRGAFSEHGVMGMSEMLGVDIAGRTLLIVGAGRIGYATALRSIGWGMRVLYVARSQHYDFEFSPINAERVSLEEGLKQADFVSLHTPLTPATKHLINAENLKLLKATAVLVNTARGPVVDEQALAAALKAGRLFAAGLDVYEDEPRVSKELLELENVALTPHIGSGARRYREMMTQIVGANVSAVLFGGKPVSVVTG